MRQGPTTNAVLTRALLIGGVLVLVGGCAERHGEYYPDASSPSGAQAAGEAGRGAPGSADASMPTPVTCSLTLTRRGPTVLVGKGYLSCVEDSDCMLVGVSCNGCCDETAIAASLSDEYRENFGRVCADYRGPVCDCIPQPAEARCEAGECAVAPL